MEDKLLRILKNIKPDIDFLNEKQLIDKGLIDSFDVIQIVSEIMDEFDIDIDADDLEPENLNSLESIGLLIEKKMSKK